MLQTLYIRSTFFLIIIIAILHILAIKYYWYFYFPWIDLIMHFLGGFWVALALLWIVHFSGAARFDGAGFRYFFYPAIIITLIVAVGWEVFEYIFRLTQMGNNYGRDTVGDILMGLLGAAAASLYTYRGRL